MAHLRLDRIGIIILAALLWALGITTLAHAQAGGFITSARQESTPDGIYARMWNATGVQISDGTVVMADTVTAGFAPQIALGKGFRTFDGQVTNIYRVVGITIGNIPGYSQGRILVRGTHNNALMDATGIAGLTRVRPSLTVATGALTAYAATDSTNQGARAVGIFQRYVNGTSLRGYVYVNFSGQLLSK